MSKVIGPANEFYRLRVTRLDLGESPEFDWREDVLWRSRPGWEPSEEDSWFVEAVTLDGREHATPIAGFSTADDARDALDEIALDLGAMSRAEFEAEYLNPRRIDG